MSIGEAKIKFEESGDYPDIIPEARDYANVPGWTSLETFIRGELGITSHRALETFRKFHNHYLKNFPVHYFTGHSIPDIDFALFFPVRGGKANMVGNHIEPHYLVAVSQNNDRVILFHRKLSTSLKTRQNFYRLTKRWAENDFSGQRFMGADINEILTVCEKPEELLALRERWFSKFLEKLEKKLHKMNQHRPFIGKWERIREFLTERDREFLYFITGKMKSDHIDFNAAHAAAAVSKRNLDIYNWIMAGQNENSIYNRTRMTEHYPWLAVALSTTKEEVRKDWRNNEIERFPSLASSYAEIEQVVDEAKPLIFALEELLSADDPDNPIRQSTIRKTMALRIDSDLLHPKKFGEILRQIDEHLPHIKLEEGMLERIHRVQKDADTTFKYLGTSFAEVLAYAQNDVQQRLLDKDGVSIKDMSDTVDYLRRVYVKTVLPYFVYRAALAGKTGLDNDVKAYLEGKIWQKSFIVSDEEGERHSPHLRPFGNMMPHNIFKLSINWHDKLRHYEPKMQSVGIHANWPVMTGAIKIPHEVFREDVTIEPLRSSEDLLNNHREFGHCINGYTANCLGLVEIAGVPRTFSHAFRIAAQGGRQEKGTLIVSEPYYSHGGAREVKVEEVDTKRDKHQTRNPPPKDSILWRAAGWYVAEINSGRLKVDWDAIDRKRRAQDFRSTDAEIGFDAKIYENCVEAFYAMRPYLPESQRHYSYERWIEKMGFDLDADRLFESGQDLSIKDFNALDYGPRTA